VDDLAAGVQKVEPFQHLLGDLLQAGMRKRLEFLLNEVQQVVAEQLNGLD